MSCDDRRCCFTSSTSSSTWEARGFADTRLREAPRHMGFRGVRFVSAGAHVLLHGVLRQVAVDPAEAQLPVIEQHQKANVIKTPEIAALLDIDKS